ncbi:type I polyketide synthase [Streptomyces sp. BA2]|uniref:type I polyketide synthase n=1 Tax=Streptomyces sp. BA2 TaxID=436595 RepID=UPI00132B73CF|nr:type I polyketide synthase [Streptomyces sp. BA2]MWA15044.1 acyltransferase domain-containing protein [Streptomyces sp. BA2]
MRPELSSTTPIAIVGMGCRFPGIESVDELWDVLVANVDTVKPVPHERFDISDFYDPTPMTPGRTVSRHGGFLTDPFGFDAAFFGISPVEAREMDPQQRLLLHVVWEALESAGTVPSRLAGSRSGVFVGQATSEYADIAPRAHEPDVRGMVGSRLRAVTAGRVSYAFDLRGPSVVLDTACSSSLVAVHAARQSLLTGESDLCIAAGVNVMVSPHDSIAYSQGDMLSPGGRCRFGDAGADGFVRSEGVGAVVLKRLDDALRDGDPVSAVLLGSAVTNDGAASGLLIRPSVEGQADMMREACVSAGIKPSELDYVEAHGTGTHVGDEVELRALAESAGQGRPADRPLLTGSVKTNVGHAEAAAGIAGLIKTALILRHGVIPASLHLDEPHALLSQDDFPVRVVTRNRPLDTARSGALLGVSSFGLSGTNAHLVVGAHVREPDPEPDPEPTPEARRTARDSWPHLLVLSARTSDSLRRLAENYAAYLGPSGPGRPHRLGDICSAAATGRDAHPHRLWVVGDDHDSLSRRLRALAAGETIPDGGIAEAGLSGDKRVVYVFSGQGSQWVGMSRALYHSSPAFRTALDACDRAVRKELGWSVLEQLASGEAEFPTDVSTVQPALWAVQVALAAAWRDRGVEPDLCMGHSMGEIAAAHVSGALSIDDAAAVICRRSRLMQRLAGQGAMLVVELSATRARQYTEAYRETVCVAVENAPTTTVLAGDPVSLAALQAELEESGILCRLVKVNVASHSPQMDSLRDDLLKELTDLSPVPVTTGMVSTVHGSKIQGPELTADYWMDNLRRPVRFADTVREVAHETESVFLEVSPHPVLVAAMDDTLGDEHGDAAAVSSLHRACDEPTELARAAGRIFAHGGRVDWQRWYGGGPRHVPSLPTYAWDVTQFRREAADPVAARGAAASRVRRIDLSSWGSTADWGSGVAVHGVSPVPPVVYLAAMLETAQEADRGTSFELRDVKLGDAHVPVEAVGDTTLQVTLDGDREGDRHARTVTVQAALRGSPSPVFCASGRAVRADTDEAGPVDAGALDDSGALDVAGALDGALARCRDYLGAQDFLSLARRHGYDIGEPFRAVEHLWRRDGEAVARVRLEKPLPQVGWETGLLSLLAARPGAASGNDGFAHVPLSFDSVRFHAELEPEFWSLSTVRSENGGASLRADVLLIAPDRRLLARFSGIRMRRLARTSSSRASTAPVTSRPHRGDAAETLVAYSAALLGMPASDIDERRSLRDLGLDSLMASQLRGHLRRSHGIEITAGRLLGAESIAGLRESLAGHGE